MQSYHFALPLFPLLQMILPTVISNYVSPVTNDILLAYIASRRIRASFAL